MNFFSLFCFCFCFCSCLYAANNNPLLSETKLAFNLDEEADDFSEDLEISNIHVEIRSRGPRRLLLGGPGSSPPRCASKCGGCMPCKPVHVPVPPGTRVTTEYYPEAWRCKCGNKLYMP